MWRKGYRGFDPGPSSWDMLGWYFNPLNSSVNPQIQTGPTSELWWLPPVLVRMLSDVPSGGAEVPVTPPPSRSAGDVTPDGLRLACLKKAMWLRTISGFWCFCEPNPRCAMKRLKLCRLPHGVADATIFPWNWPVAAAGSGKPVLEVRPEGMILVCKAPRTPHGSNTVHQFPSVWFPRVILVLRLMLFASSCWWFLPASTARCSWDSLQDKLSAIAEVEGDAGACCGSGSCHSQSGESGGPTKLGTSSTGTEWSGTAGATFCSGSDADRCNEVNYNLTKAGGRKWRCCDVLKLL